VLFVGDRLPTDSQTQLTYDELRELLRSHLQWLHAKGLQPTKVSDRRQDMMDEPVIVEDTTAVGFLISAAEQLRIDVDDLDVALVTEAHLAYFAEIGAVGPEAADPDVDLRAIDRGFRAAAELPPVPTDDSAT
jgi:hypothetical protein